MNKVNKSIVNLVVSQVKNVRQYKNDIMSALHILLNGNFIKYDIETAIYKEDSIELSDIAFQEILSHLNEKTKKRKTNGVYYTPNDVARYMICNAFINQVFTENEKTHNFDNGIEKLKTLNSDEIEELLYNMTIIDPTCGTGEFLLNVLDLKYTIATSQYEITDNQLLKICTTIFGNDIDDESIDISKIRLFFYLANKIQNKENFIKLAETLNNQFYNIDFVSKNKKIDKRFDIIIGNPPYVEYGKYKNKEKLKNKFGNIYADVIKNSIDMLKDKGVVAYIVPLSYTSTARMESIRRYVIDNTEKQFILNFADRPDCLFNGVHQKLNIIIAQKGNSNHKVFTSNYKHWYSEERNKLLNGREVRLCTFPSKQFIPKIGNAIEESIFNKIYTTTTQNMYDIQTETGIKLFLNMRACFWIKSFSFNPGSKEYKELKYTNKYNKFVLCVLNSSLFWLYWTIMSDCWHITSKELKSFYIPKIMENKVFNELSNLLEAKLEKTKKFVGTKQIDYEYKHKLCKDVIDRIDDELAIIYNLTDEELKYIKSFAMKYRIGGETID